MLEQMTAAQFIEWQAKDLAEPIGHAGTHEILAQIAALITNYMTGGRGDPVDPWNFHWWRQRPPEPEASVDTMFAALEMLGAKRG